MKKVLLTGTALLTLVSTSAMAADLRPARGPAPVYTKAPMMAPAFSWTGCYIGGNAGGLWAKKDWTNFGQAESSRELRTARAGCPIRSTYHRPPCTPGL